MPTTPSWPGVYVEELASGVRTIPLVATSVTAFVGRTLRGEESAPIRLSSWSDFERQCGGLWVDSELGYSVYQFFLNGGSTALVSRVTDSEAQAASVTLTSTAGDLVLAASSAGEWGNRIRVSVDHGTAGTPTATTDTNHFHLAIDEIDPEVLASTGNYMRSIVTRESFPNVSIEATASRSVTTILAQQSALARVTTVPAARPTGTSAIAAMTNGNDGTVAGMVKGDWDAAIDRLKRADIVNLVCIPPLNRTSDIGAPVWTKASEWCREHLAMLLIDPPSSWTSAQNAADLTGLTSLRDRNTAFYFPRIVAPDPLQSNVPRPFAPTGAVAGVISRTDATHGAWKPPAGNEAVLRGVTGLEQSLTAASVGLINRQGVNALRVQPASGPVVWGARTSVGADAMASDWKYLPVRRTGLIIEEAISRGLQWAVFEPNGERLWGQIRLAVDSFMHQLFRQGVFQGNKPSEAYLVRCDETTTTQTDIYNGTVNVIVGFAPLKAAEFVILSYEQVAGQVAS
ncbi:MAG: phage tail sheath subtilisin-like domain-containing protein [Pseudomonadota bacterium]